MTFRWIPVVLIVTAALLAASCSDPGRGDPETIRPIPTTAPVTTTSSSTTTTTTLATTTTTSSTSTTTTQAVDPEAATKQEIADVVVQSRRAYLQNVYNLPPSPTQEFRSFYTEDLIARTASILDDLRNAGLRTKAATPDLESITVGAVEIISNSEAVAVACVVSNSIVYDPTTGAIENDDLSARLNSYFLIKRDSSWLVDRIQENAVNMDSTACD